MRTHTDWAVVPSQAGSCCSDSGEGEGCSAHAQWFKLSPVPSPKTIQRENTQVKSAKVVVIVPLRTVPASH